MTQVQNPKKTSILKVISFIAVFIAILGFFVFINLEEITETSDSAYEEEFISPQGTNTVIVRYDNVSRPFVFHNNKQIFAYPKSGFMETVSFEIKWLSESRILLYNRDRNEDYVINIP